MGFKVVIGLLGTALLVALVVTMVRISGPAVESGGPSGLMKRESALRDKADRILKEANGRFSSPKGPVIASSSLRFEGEVLRIQVGPGWDRMRRSDRARLVEYVASEYVPFWKTQMKSRREPAIVLREGDRRVGLHTQIDHWVH